MSHRLKDLAAPIIDAVLWPFVLLAAVFLRAVRQIGYRRLPLVRNLLLRIGLLPIRRHYYEPFYDPRAFNRDPASPRPIGGIDWDVERQLMFLDDLVHATETIDWPQTADDPEVFALQNPTFLAGDAEFWYQMVRAKKPGQIIEVGSGNSTLVARMAIEANQADDPAYTCAHVCIEPFEMPWLERTGVEVKRSKVEDLPPEYFDRLEAGDVLFIDSTHVIRPEGDVLFEYLEILPRLKPGVIVHIHDIFSPRNYLTDWLTEDLKLWNEQYLLEAFLSFNSSFRILAALNLLKNDHFVRLRQVCPHLAAETEPGSFYIVRT